MTVEERIPPDVFSAYTKFGTPLSIDIIDMGLINKTYLVTTAHKKFILQEVSPIFDTTIMVDSDAVAHHLARYGIDAPRIYPTDTDELYIANQGRVFRALKFIAGKSSHTITSLRMAESAGAVVGRFHAALLDFNYDYRSKRRHGGDYRFHKDNLIAALQNHTEHEYFNRVESLAQKMLYSLDNTIAGLSTTARNAHGDPKISNIIFDMNDEGICLIDFDTLGKTGWSLEIGDALRSWCNPNQEDALDPYVNLEIAEYALRGYGSEIRGSFTKKEAHELVIHAQAITLCLAIRYLTDVLNEKYWAFDKYRFLRPAEHNWLRACSMHALFTDFVAKAKMLSEITETYLF